MERKIYIDHLRLFCIVLLFPYHAAMAWNCWGEGNYIILGANPFISSFIVAVSPWYMTLLFVLAGISTKYSLQTRSYRQHIKERIYKLLLPLLTGTFVIIPVMTYIADKVNCGYTGNYFSHYIIFFRKWTDLTGYDGGFSIGHLWFLLYLFIISLISIGIIIIQKKYTPILKIKDKNVFTIIFLCLVVMMFIPIKLAGKSIVTYLFLYLLGYYIFSEEETFVKLQKFQFFYIIIFIISTIINIYLFLWSDTKYNLINTIAMYFSGTFGILTFLCLGKSLLNKSNKITKKLTEYSFLIYIFHFIYIVIFENIFNILGLNLYIVLFISVIAAFIATYITCILVSKVPILEFLFGFRRKRSNKK